MSSSTDVCCVCGGLFVRTTPVVIQHGRPDGVTCPKCAPLPSVRAVAVAFMHALEENLTAAQLREARRRNARQTVASVCHTHDHHDANMSMHAAFVSFGIVDSEGEPGADAASQAHADLWNAAWDFARDHWLGGRP